ncbi:unnamed protein product [Amoebophrya sp. A25]|nr:unnamed protein product [Amoebophrya sp. A25]|eukprot:GSA25T00014088001.1
MEGYLLLSRRCPLGHVLEGPRIVANAADMYLCDYPQHSTINNCASRRIGLGNTVSICRKGACNYDICGNCAADSVETEKQADSHDQRQDLPPDLMLAVSTDQRHGGPPPAPGQPTHNLCCLQGHELRSAKVGRREAGCFECDRCKKLIGVGDTRLFCRDPSSRCDYDICSVCADPGPESRKIGCVCLAGHELQQATVRPGETGPGLGYVCDDPQHPGDRRIPVGAIRFFCRHQGLCAYDICQDCRQRGQLEASDAPGSETFWLDAFRMYALIRKNNVDVIFSEESDSKDGSVISGYSILSLLLNYAWTYQLFEKPDVEEFFAKSIMLRNQTENREGVINKRFSCSGETLKTRGPDYLQKLRSLLMEASLSPTSQSHAQQATQGATGPFPARVGDGGAATAVVGGGAPFREASRIWAGSEIKAQIMLHVPDGLKSSVADLGSPDTETKRAAINGWISEQTQEMIPNFFRHGELPIEDPNAVAIVHAVAFKGEWVVKFPEEETVPEGFHVSSSEVVTVMMMNQNFSRQDMKQHGIHFYDYGDVNFKQTAPRMQLLRLPFQGDWEMVVAKPELIEIDGKKEEPLTALTNLANAFGAGDGAGTLEKQPFSFADLFAQSTETKCKIVSVKLPRWRLEYAADDVLEKIPEGFKNRNGKFKGRMAMIRHMAVIEVNEEGAKGAAVTGGATRGDVSGMFYVDRPVLYAIRNKKTDTVVFFGDLIRPEPALEETESDREARLFWGRPP